MARFVIHMLQSQSIEAGIRRSQTHWKNNSRDANCSYESGQFLHACIIDTEFFSNGGNAKLYVVHVDGDAKKVISKNGHFRVGHSDWLVGGLLGGLLAVEL